ncbi:MAG: hypothetical protein AAGE18_04255 [Pseudomonadota bacterium]
MIEFMKWFSALSDERRGAYTAQYPEPDGWEGFYRDAKEAGTKMTGAPPV